MDLQPCFDHPSCRCQGWILGISSRFNEEATLALLQVWQRCSKSTSCGSKHKTLLRLCQTCSNAPCLASGSGKKCHGGQHDAGPVPLDADHAAILASGVLGDLSRQVTKVGNMAMPYCRPTCSPYCASGGRSPVASTCYTAMAGCSRASTLSSLLAPRNSIVWWSRQPRQPRDDCTMDTVFYP